MLASLTGVDIAADYTNGTALVGVDDITPLDKVALVPEPATGLSLLARWRRRQRRGRFTCPDAQRAAVVGAVT